MSSHFCSRNCGRPANTKRNDGLCCQRCSDTSKTTDHETQCDLLYNEYLITQFTLNAKTIITHKWTCSMCTFDNESFRSKCQVCNTNKQASNIDTDIIMASPQKAQTTQTTNTNINIHSSPSKPQKKRRKRKREEMCDDDAYDSDIVILNDNHNKKKRKINAYENTDNSCNHNTNHNICKPYEMDIDPMELYIEKEEEEFIDPRLHEMEQYHKRRETMLAIPGDHVVDYDIMDTLHSKLSCFHHEKLIRMEQDIQFNKYKNDIKKLDEEINKKPKDVFNYKISEYYVHENTQMIQVQRVMKKLPFSEDNKVLLFCCCCLHKTSTVSHTNPSKCKSTLTEEQKAMIEKKRLAALERLNKNGLRPLVTQRKQNKPQIQLEKLMQNKLVLYGTISEITIDNGSNNNQNMVHMLIRIKKYNKYLTEYDADPSKHKSADFHDKTNCHFYIVKELSQFGTFGLQLKNIETFFSSTVIQLGSSWCNKYYYIDKTIGNQAPLVTINDIINILKEHKTLKRLHYPMDLIHLIATITGECEIYTDIKNMNNNLNSAQIRAVYNVSQNAVSVIQGPPGTGKTYTAVNIVQRYRMLHEKSRVVLTAHTHAACDQILAEMIEYSGTKDLNITRYCNPSQMKMQSLIHFTHREKMKHHFKYDDMQQLFIRAKSRRLSAQQREDERQMAKQLERDIICDILKQSDAVIMTCFAAAGYMLVQSDIKFDLIIIDESTQIIETEVMGVVNLLNEDRMKISAMKWKHRQMNFNGHVNSNKKFNDKESASENESDDEYKYNDFCDDIKFSEHISKLKNISSKKIVMIGDPKQLSPVISSNHAKCAGAGITWFERILSKISLDELMNRQNMNRNMRKFMMTDNEIFTMLNVQRRGWDILHEFNSIQFYHGKLKHYQIWNESNPKRLIGGFKWKNNKPLSFVAVNSKQRKWKGNYDNTMEATVIINMIRHILVYGNDKRINDREDVIRIKSLKEIGIITMHRQQGFLLANEIRKAFGTDTAKHLIVSTVDAFQGQQKELIILSLCRTDCFNSDFMKNENRINVMLSRAKKAMIIVGNIKELGVNHMFRNLRQYLTNHAVIQNV